MCLLFLQACKLASSCEECTTQKTNFDCSWCHSVSRCSDGIDSFRQEWTELGCHNKVIFNTYKTGDRKTYNVENYNKRQSLNFIPNKQKYPKPTEG